MDSPCYTTQSLERLSTDELSKLAEKHGLDIPQDIERVFIIEELMYLNEDSGSRAGDIEDIYYIPKKRDISIVEVLVRDPLWAFVFWEIKKHDQDFYEAEPDFEGYCLKVIPLKEGSQQPDTAGEYIVSVGKDNAWYLGFPPDDRRFFKIELCVSGWENLTVLAVSQPFRMPRLIDIRNTGDVEIQALYRNPMAQLSGVNRFTMLRNMDRQLRLRGD